MIVFPDTETQTFLQQWKWIIIVFTVLPHYFNLLKLRDSFEARKQLKVSY